MATQAKPLSVLISGGGVAGPCLAWWLSKSTLNPKPSITILERAPVPRTSGQSIDIRGAAVTVMKQMGLEKDILAARTTETGLVFLGDNGKILAQFDATGDPKKQSATSEYEILRADLAKVFIDATSDFENVKYIFGQRIDEITQGEDGVDVTFTGDLPRQRYDLVVGADGYSSKTRRLIFGPDQPEHQNFLGGYFAFFSLPYVAELDEPPLWRWYNATGRNLSTRPHRNPETTGAYLGYFLPQKKHDEEMENALKNGVEEQRKLLRQRFEGAGWQAERLCDGMDAADDFYLTPLTQIKLPKWSKGRCVLIGDAAHAPTPLTGAGTSLAMVGSYILAGELAKSAGNVEMGLENYEKIFKPIVEKAQTIMPGVPQIIYPQSQIGLSILRGLVSLVYRTRIYKLLGGAGTVEKDWDLPEYKWVMA